MSIKKLVEKIKKVNSKEVAEYLGQEEHILIEFLSEEALDLIKGYATKNLTFTLNEYHGLMNKLYGSYDYTSSKEECRYYVLYDYIEHLIDREANPTGITKTYKNFGQFKREKVAEGLY